MTKEKILIVEDDEGLRELLIEALENLEYTCLSASTANEAKQLCIDYQPFMILLDYQLPDATAKEFIVDLENAELAVIPPFVLTTGQGDERIAVEMMKLGARDYIIKDSSFFEVIRIVIPKIILDIENEQKLKRSEEALRQSEEKFRAIVEQTDDLIAISDSKGNVIYASTAIYNLFGWSPKEVSGIPFTDMVDESQITEAFTDFQNILFNDIPLKGKEFKLRRKDGSSFYGEIFGIRFQPDSLNGVLVIIHDVTERKNYLEKIRLSEEKSRKILQTALDGFGIINDKREIVEVNDSICKMTGFSPSELLSMRIEDLDVDESVEDMDAHVNSLAKKNSDRFETRIKRKDGSIFYVDVSLNYMESASSKVFAFLRDITKQKETETFLRTSKELLQNLLDKTSCFIETGNVDNEYDNMLSSICQITGAQYGSFNLYDENGRTFTTKSLYGLELVIDKLTALMGFNPLNKVWNYDAVREEKIRDRIITEFKSFQELTAFALTQKISVVLEDTFGIGSVYVVRIAKKNHTVGDFTLIFSPGKKLENTEITELYVNQAAMYLERESAKGKLQESEEKYRYLFEFNPQPMYIFDQETLRFIEVNDAMIRHYGYSKEEFLKMTLKDLKLPDDVPYLFEQIDQANKGIKYGQVSRHILKSKEVITIEVTAIPVFSNGRKAMHCMVNDITERVRAESALYQQMSEMTKFHNLTVDRELRMIELKKEVNNLLVNLGKTEKYEIVK
ncbi:MAG: PAS domain S-box protein [Paludibacter sp.]|nr:PAS domain S-box protein [Paludibacter sp.]